MSTELAMRFQVEGALLASALECEAEVFLRWFGNTAEQLADEYGPYEDSTVFLVVADRQDEVIGTVRLLRGGQVFSSEAVFDGELQRRVTHEKGRIAVLEQLEGQSGGVAKARHGAGGCDAAGRSERVETL